MSDLSINGIKKSYGRNQILKDICLEVNSGEIVAILGANGCGKSTLLKIIAGCLKCDEGSICYFDEDAIKNKNVFMKFAGYVPQDNSLMDEMSVMDNLKFWYCDSKRNLNEDFEKGMLNSFGLWNYRKMPVKKLSGGMKKRLGIACAIAKEPKVLILDEPGAALDLVCKEEIKKFLLSFKENGGIVVMTSHELAEFEICDKWYVIDEGKLIEISKTNDISKIIERMR